MEDAAMEEFEGMDTKDPNAVVIGLAPSKFRYDLVRGGGGMKKQWNRVGFVFIHLIGYGA